MAFGNILTNAGIARFLAASPEDPITITELVVGDGGGPNNTVNATMTELVNETWRGTASAPIRDPENADVLTFEAVVPAAVGGFVIREVGLYDDEGDLVLVGVTNEIDKPLLPEVLGYTITIRIHMKLLNSEDVELVVFEHGSIDHQGLYNRSAADAHPAASISVDPVPDDETIETAQDQLDALWTSRALSFDDLDAMAAHDTNAGGKLTGLVAGIGPYRWVSGSALTADGYSVIDSDVSGQWVLNAGQALTFTHKLTTGGTWTHDLETLPGKIAKLTVDATDVSANDVLVKVDGSTIDTLTPGQKDWYLVEPATSIAVEAENTGFDISFAAYDTQSYDFSAQISDSYDVRFSPDGTKFYIMRNSSPAIILQYSLSTPWQLNSGVSYVDLLDISGTVTSPTGFHLSDDGTKLYVAAILSPNQIVYQWNLSTAHDITSAVYFSSKTFSHSPSGTAPQIYLTPTLDKMLITALAPSGPSNVHQFSVTAGDITTATADSVTLNVFPQTGYLARGIAWSAARDKFFVISAINKRIYQYDCPTPGTLAGATFDSSFDLSPEGSTPNGLAFTPDGDKFFTTTGSTIRRYTSGQEFTGDALVHLEYQL